MPSHKITLHGNMQGIQLRYISEEHHTLLNTLEQSVPVEFQCREGYCGACRVRLKRGKIGYRTRPVAFIRDGEILPCCCYPMSDIELEL
ncbi:MAG: class I ribonucleotide reductase maintenance protein YfaE [Morganella sp. (in: enterobacteria)]|uniref:(2Fe-2S)-binding protein n=1 Tax=Morganella psychrotolerans TaxID=368603 RepID=A0A1B8HEK5_9GAMM|nr:class I ribonucleotide reductase maintenance protein YfaE [Morganella psychrotolerans]OBU07484.1 (2Fe-2S)-binding protein [Morganella psychrotolerans]